jgi:hypothetical protein
VNIQTVAQIIQLILAPVVMITSCALVINGLLQRYGAINDRMRAMTHERLDVLRDIAGEASTVKDTVAVSPSYEEALVQERLSEIDAQLPKLLRRHNLVHTALLAVYDAIVLFVGSMLAIAIAAIQRLPWAATLALVVFLGGTVALLVGVVLVALEIRSSQEEIRYEVLRVLGLHPNG